MQVRFASPSGTFALDLTDADGALQFTDWDDMGVMQRFGKLSALAELLGTDYLFRHGDLDRDLYQSTVSRLMPVIKAASEPAPAVEPAVEPAAA